MNDAPIELSAELLLGHERFVRSIARGLLGNEHDVQDAVQDTWLRALQRGPRALAALPRWLERVVRSRATDLRRADVARRRREQQVAGDRTAESAVERLSVQHDVVAAVLALHEPYRSVVLLRYYHGLEPTEIATRLQAKAATVRTQLVRAHEMLKERLDRDHGRAAWAALALPLRPGAAALPAATMLAGLVAAGLGLVGAFAFFGNSDAPLPAVGSAVTDAALSTTVRRATEQPTIDAQVRREVADVTAQEPRGKAIPEVIGPRATLLDLDTHQNHERAAFSFEFGYGGTHKVRKRKDRNDWDVVLGGNRFRVDTLPDDLSLIVDLGAMPLVALVGAPLEFLEKRVREAAAKMPTKGKRPADPGTVAELGHSYFLWTNDTDSDLATLCEVVELVPNDTCVLEWYSTEDGSWARGSLHSPLGQRTLAELATQLREFARPDITLREPKVTLQVRSGAIGGNPCRVDLAGTTTAYIREQVEAPLAFDKPPDTHDQPQSFSRGGTVPPGMKFVITRATWWGAAAGDSNGDGCLHAQIGDVELVKVERTDGVVRGDWTGRVEIGPNEEARCFLEISNSSYGELILEGTFEPLAK